VYGAARAAMDASEAPRRDVPVVVDGVRHVARVWGLPDALRDPYRARVAAAARRRLWRLHREEREREGMRSRRPALEVDVDGRGEGGGARQGGAGVGGARRREAFTKEEARERKKTHGRPLKGEGSEEEDREGGERWRAVARQGASRRVSR
jgi:hypothetical protein